jgi:hypothetical protein
MIRPQEYLPPGAVVEPDEAIATEQVPRDIHPLQRRDETTLLENPLRKLLQEMRVQTEQVPMQAGKVAIFNAK